jgi:hypothetical protein
MIVPWAELLLFMAGVLLLALYGLAASGHFPREFRAPVFRTGAGAIVMWGTMTAACVAGTVTLIVAWAILPWHMIVLGGGAMLLVAPLLLQPFPDRFVNGHISLLTFATGAMLFAAMIWATA